MPKGADNDDATEKDDTHSDGCGNGQVQPRRLKQRGTGTRTFGIRVQQLESYRYEHGHCNVPYIMSCRRKRKREWEEGRQFHPSGSDDEGEESEVVLGRWVAYQRVQYRRLIHGEQSSLTPEKVDILNDLGFMWTKEELVAHHWKTMFEDLKHFKELHGHCNATLSVPSLGRWVRSQRDHFWKFTDGKESPITQEQIDALDELGFEWDRGNAGWAKWMYKLDELREFKSEHGHCTVSSRTDPTLAHWLHRQRFHYRLFEKGKASKMNNERIQALNEIDGWLGKNKRALPVSSSSHAQAVKSGDAPQAFSRQQGNTSPAASSTPALSKLSSMPPTATATATDFISSKTRKVTTTGDKPLLSSADDESDATDNEANDTTSSSEPTWTDMLYQLILYNIAHGHSNPPRPKKGTNDRLFRWAQRQRKLYHERKRNRSNVPHHCTPDPFTCAANGLNTELSYHRVAALEHIGFQWNTNEDRWEQRHKERHLSGPDPGPGPRESDPKPEEGSKPQKPQPEEHMHEHEHESEQVEAEQELAPAPKTEDPGSESVPLGTELATVPVSSPAPLPVSVPEDRALEPICFSQYDIGDRWEQRYKELCEFQLLHGHCNVPTKSSKLGRWVELQRGSFKLHKTNPKYFWTDERKARLDAIGFRWKIKPDRVGWDGRYEELKQFRESHGHCAVPQHYSLNKQLGKWVSKMKYEYNLKKRGTGGTLLTDERIAKLKDVGFWDKPQPLRAKGNDTQAYSL